MTELGISYFTLQLIFTFVRKSLVNVMECLANSQSIKQVKNNVQHAHLSDMTLLATLFSNTVFLPSIPYATPKGLNRCFSLQLEENKFGG